MPATTQDPIKDPASAVNEAVRATAEAARRTMQSSQDAVRISRDMYEGTTDAARKLFLAYTSAVTAGLKAVFEIQNVAMATRLQVFDVANSSLHELANQVNDATRQSQAAAIEAWQASVRAGERMISTSDKA